MAVATTPNSGYSISPQQVLQTLGKEYGPFEWTPRYDPALELVYTILSQHTSDINSERAFANLMTVFGSLEAVARADTAEIEKAVETAGLFRVKASRIRSALNQILASVGSFDLSFLREMPLEEAKCWLKQLDGIGPKSAAVVLCFALGMPAMPVDTHVFRVAKRIALLGPKVTIEQAHDILERLVSPEDVFAFHLLLINHGRETCKALRPRCDECVLAHACPSRPILQRSAKGAS